MEVYPQNLTSLDGKDVTFKCHALGAPLPNVTWIFNGKFPSRFHIHLEF
jgi:protein sidekick